MNFKSTLISQHFDLTLSREKLLASVAALSLLGISPQQTFAAQITTNQAVQQTKKITGNVSDAMGPIIGATVKVKGTKMPQ